MTTTDVSRSQTYAAPVEQVFGAVLPAPLQEIFSRRFAAIPAISRIEDQDGEWGRVGQTRTVVLADGGRMTETLTDLEAPHSFGYRIAPVSGPLRLLVTHADGRWTFDPVDDTATPRTRVTWSWAITPRHRVAALAMPLLARMWQGYARHGLARIGRLLPPR